MPTYDYACPDCGAFDALRSLAQRNEPCPCPACGAASSRILGAAPRLACLSSGVRHAFATNERAAHAPRTSKEVGGPASRRHPAGCGCCAGGKRSATVTGTDGSKAFPSKRPWMISH
jgi:putative FmdB family regulatory protein